MHNNNDDNTQYKYKLIMNLLHWRVTSSEWPHLSLGLTGQLWHEPKQEKLLRQAKLLIQICWVELPGLHTTEYTNKVYFTI